MKKRILGFFAASLLMVGAVSGAVISKKAAAETNFQVAKADGEIVINVTNVEYYADWWCRVDFSGTNPFAVDGHTYAYIKVNTVQCANAFNDGMLAAGYWNQYVPAIRGLTNFSFEWFDNTGTCYAVASYPAGDFISLNTDSVDVQTGSTYQLTAVASGDVTWESSDEDVATVSPTGLVTGVAAGTATITATCGSESAECEVTVADVVLEKLPAPGGLVLNLIGDGGYICAFAPVSHATGFRFEYYDVADSTDPSHLVGSHTGANGGALNPTAAGLVAGAAYYVRVVSIGDGETYANSNPSGVVSVNNGLRAGQNTYIYHTGESYANYFLGLSLCSTNGASMAFDSADWTNAKKEYDNVFVGERNNLKNKTTSAATNCISQYNYILGKYSEDEYDWLTDFIGTDAARPSTNQSLIRINDSNNSSSTFTIIAVISLVAFAGAGIVFYSRKRKHN